MLRLSAGDPIVKTNLRLQKVRCQAMPLKAVSASLNCPLASVRLPDASLSRSAAAT
ncbi:MAG: hypothetical protein IIC72_12245 [Acidobacteria bacterium]|nr:hypothetical protein [Acidobacteriota bacterium]